jgi:hypothetical protein
MIWYDIWCVIYDKIRCDMIWYMMWYKMIHDIWFMIWYVTIRYDMMIYLLTVIGLSPGGSNTVHIYTQTIHTTTQITTEQHK